ncbi:extracellular solute-binding protein [Phaeovulum vinaykumarii]|uniref:Iron(III) transport system substrate-binding protein n=1 Tax=Phaeovulum vinaykumarii TaxID=407234 RepID=A0A1N7LK75_9RHOB|nr:extracellular solute-binding protein [Phaeovulum vinaykumarii]SIS74189.1 iron(III) transport system substrate-binding protein [Phaeovulum vinaykumarii]SOC04919.1 iron(III) transport system substrate-binding protein [Phaeovulum vinaykumarii]
MKTGFLAALLALAAGAAQADVTIYSAGPGGLIKDLSAGFTAKTGIQTNVFQATTGKVMARLEAEAANPVADVVISAAWGTATQFAEEGLLLDYDSPNAATVPDYLKMPGAVAQGVAGLVIAWNPASGTPRPSDWADLAKPEYKDLVTLPDPAASGGTFTLVEAFVANGMTDVLEGLAANGAIVAGANKAALNPVLQGAKAAVFAGVDYITMGAAAKGETVEAIFPTSGTVVAPRPMMILKSTENADDAKAFVDYVLSEEGQAMVAKVFLMPSRTDITADRPLIGDLKLLPTEGAPAREAVLATFSGLFN